MALSDVGAAIATSLLDQTGSDWTYSRGPTTGTVTFYKADLPPVLIDNGSGLITEVVMASFRGVAATFLGLFGKPLKFDRITDGTKSYEVNPIVDKCYYTVGGLIHIHAKEVAN